MYLGEDTLQEVARLIRQDMRFTVEMGDLFSKHQWQRIYRVLDLGCGPGGWLLSTAKNHPSIQELVGIDINPRVLTIARNLARAEQIHHVRFLEGDVRHLDNIFVASSFDLIQGRLVNSFLLPADWPRLIKQCFRLLRPGGILCLVEHESTFTNSRALEDLSVFLYEAHLKSGRSFAHSARGTGITFMLPTFLRTAGFLDIHAKGICLDASHGAEGFEDWREDHILLCHTFRDFVVRAGVTTAETIEILLEESLRDMDQPEFSALVMNVCTWGIKPSQ
jgi:ubiquinone/menaquinone biosynthesis C-methylase UbiE